MGASFPKRQLEEGTYVNVYLSTPKRYDPSRHALMTFTGAKIRQEDLYVPIPGKYTIFGKKVLKGGEEGKETQLSSDQQIINIDENINQKYFTNVEKKQDPLAKVDYLLFTTISGNKLRIESISVGGGSSITREWLSHSYDDSANIIKMIAKKDGLNVDQFGGFIRKRKQINDKYILSLIGKWNSNRHNVDENGYVINPVNSKKIRYNGKQFKLLDKASDDFIQNGSTNFIKLLSM